MYKKPEPSTDFKLNLQKGCKELNIVFEHTSVKDVTIDDIVLGLLKIFDSYCDNLNKTLRK